MGSQPGRRDPSSGSDGIDVEECCAELVGDLARCASSRNSDRQRGSSSLAGERSQPRGLRRRQHDEVRGELGCGFDQGRLRGVGAQVGDAPAVAAQGRSQSRSGRGREARRSGMPKGRAGRSHHPSRGRVPGAGRGSCWSRNVPRRWSRSRPPIARRGRRDTGRSPRRSRLWRPCRRAADRARRSRRHHRTAASAWVRRERLSSIPSPAGLGSATGAGGTSPAGVESTASAACRADTPAASSPCIARTRRSSSAPYRRKPPALRTGESSPYRRSHARSSVGDSPTRSLSSPMRTRGAGSGQGGRHRQSIHTLLQNT